MPAANDLPPLREDSSSFIPPRPARRPERPKIVSRPIADDKTIWVPPPTEQAIHFRPHTAQPSFWSGIWGWVAGLPTRAEAQAEQLEDRLVGQKAGAVSHSQVARALEKELEKTLNHLLQDTIAHNQYLVGISSTDFERYLPLKERLAAELVLYLEQVIVSRDYKLLGPITVDLIEAASIPPGGLQVKSYILKENSVKFEPGILADHEYIPFVLTNLESGFIAVLEGLRELGYLEFD